MSSGNVFLNEVGQAGVREWLFRHLIVAHDGVQTDRSRDAAGAGQVVDVDAAKPFQLSGRPLTQFGLPQPATPRMTTFRSASALGRPRIPVTGPLMATVREVVICELAMRSASRDEKRPDE